MSGNDFERVRNPLDLGGMIQKTVGITPRGCGMILREWETIPPGLGKPSATLGRGGR